MNGEEAAALAKQAYSEYPYEWGSIEIYILSLTRGFSQMPDDETAAELRRLCEFTMEKCTNAIIRKRAVYTMIYIEDDEHVERWFAEAPDNPDYLETERREERYLDRQQWELFYPQKQNNRMDLLNNLLGKMGCYHEACDPEWRIASRQRRLDLLDALFKGTDRVLLSSRYCNCLIELAMALADAGRMEEAMPPLPRQSTGMKSIVSWGKAFPPTHRGWFLFPPPCGTALASLHSPESCICPFSKSWRINQNISRTRRSRSCWNECVH